MISMYLCNCLCIYLPIFGVLLLTHLKVADIVALYSKYFLQVLRIRTLSYDTTTPLLHLRKLKLILQSHIQSKFKMPFVLRIPFTHYQDSHQGSHVELDSSVLLVYFLLKQSLCFVFWSSIFRRLTFWMSSDQLSCRMSPLLDLIDCSLLVSNSLLYYLHSL